MPEVRLSAGTVTYEDTGGEGTVVVLLHGVAMDGSLWDRVVYGEPGAGGGEGTEGLSAAYRCVVPTLPLGGHARPMRPDADLSVRGVALLVAEFLESLDLRDVTLVLNDWGGAQALVAEGRDERVGRLVLTSCEAFTNYPPGLPGRNLGLLGKIPRGAGLGLAAYAMRLRPAQRLPMTWGWMAKRPLPPELVDAWFRPLRTSAGVRRDLHKYLRGVPQPAELARWSEALRGFDRPALVAWAAEDRVMPPEHGRRLAALLPRSSYAEIPDSYALIPRDQPARLVAELRAFLENGRSPGSGDDRR
ncbi:alpha/beta hydrolase [Streptomyces sp. ODS28]|uniref:alpha/beta fold hydrolase n=1 Tax=Streptomyces sp. ODS28 TaxID=3136688 RepID=UPI0031E7B32E